MIGNTNTGSAPRIDIKYCGDNYGGCPADIAQNISNYEVSGGTWSKSVSPSGSGDELLVFEISGDVPPTNTKLLGLNDVEFSVGTDSASVVETIPQTVNGQVEQTPNNACGLERYDENHTCGQMFSQSASLTGTTFEGIELQLYKTSASGSGTLHAYVVDGTWTRDVPSSSILYDMGTLDIATITDVCTSGGSGCNPNTYESYTFSGSGSYTLGSSGSTEYVILHADHNNSGFYVGAPVLNPSTYDGTNSEQITKWGTQSINTQSSRDLNIKFVNVGSENNIISATGLTDNTSSPQHYAFTRDGNDWEIYQNGVSEATNTASTSLGSNGDSTLISDDFTTDNWTDSSKMDVQGGVIDAEGVRDGTNYSIHRDLGETLEDDFVFRSKVVVDNYSVGSVGYGKGMIIGLSDKDDSNHDKDNQDSISIRLSARETSGDGFYANWSNADEMWNGAGGGRIGTTTLGTGTFYLEIIKDGTDVTYTIYSDSSYSTSIGTKTISSVDVTGLQYIVARNECATCSNQSGSVAVEIDDMTITQSPPNYTTNIDGMIDEYFIDSTALTSTEIDQVYENGKELTPIATTNAVTTDYDDSSVVGGNNYYYSVKATNAIGDSDFLTPFVAGLAGTPPGVPTGVSTAINSPNTAPLDITVSWSSPSNVGSGTLTGFEIYRDGVLVDTVGLVTSYPDTVPSGGGTFVYSMKAVSTHGTSGLSGTSSITTPSIPDTPAAPTGSINDPNGSPLDITVSWVAPNAGGSAIINYDLYRSSTSGSGFTIVQAGVTGLTHTDTTPSAGTWYYTVAANNLVGSSAQSPELSVSTPSVPSAVSDLAGSTVSDTAINLTWSAPSNGGSNIIDYSVYRDGVSIDTVTTPGYSDTGLTQQTSYTYTVYARNNVGTSLISNSVSQETHGVPAAVPSFQATSASLDAITLSWTEPNDYNSAITNYVIERESPVGGGFAPLDTISPATTYSDTGLVSVQEYNYRIKAVNAYGNGPTTTSSTITLPAPPTDVVVTPSTSTSELTVTWTTPTLTTGITGYQIVREDGIGTGFNPVTIASGTSFTDTGLSTNIYYNYKMASVTVQGNSAYSNTYVQTTYHLPNGVESLTATPGELIDASLSWSAPTVPYGYITGYEIYQSTVGTPNTLIDSITATSYVATDLDPTVTYYWLVAPVTIHGSNSTGNIANATATSAILIGDIEVSTDVNPEKAAILFGQVRTGNSTALTVTYPNTYDLTCEFEYKFARSTQSYSNLVPTTVSSTENSHTFNFNNSDNEIISAHCYDENTNPGGVNPNDPNDGKDQINFSTQPIVTQVNDFQKGLYGISGGFGIFDLATLFVVIISMVGFNRKNPAVGVGIMITFIGAMAYFGIIETPTIVMGAIALVAVLAIGVARNKL